MSEGCRGPSSVKLALGRLLPSTPIRTQIERDAQTIQVLAVRGSLVATTVLLKTLRNGHACPPVQDPTWWRNCISVCGYTHGRPPSQTEQLVAIQDVAKELFGYETYQVPSNEVPIASAVHPPLCCDYLCMQVSALVNEMQTACKNMVAKTFHKQLGHAFQREICLYLQSTGANLSTQMQRHIVRASCHHCTGHWTPQAFPDDCPADLRQHVLDIGASWSAKHQSALPCPYPSSIEIDTKMTKLASLLHWMYDLQEHRIDCVQRMAYLLPVHLPRPGRRVESFFSHRSAKPQAILPLFSPEVRHIQINPSTLASMVNGLVGRGELPDAARIKTATASQAEFLKHFPGLKTFQRRSRYRDGDTFTFQSFRTDGVSASLFFASKRCYAKRFSPDQAATESVKKRRKTATGKVSEAHGAPPISMAGKRVVCIDPGRNDMVYAVYGTEMAVEGRFAVPTAEFRQRCRTDKAKHLGEKHLKSVSLNDGRTLWSAMNCLPTSRDIFQWDDFLAAYLPLLTDIIVAKRARCLRRTRFEAYIRRDRVLDQIIKQILGGSLRPFAKESTVVGLGDANACSTGFGHAAAPQGRLRFRMEKVHRISVTMIDEFRTSQVCSMCRSARLYKAKLHGRRSWILEACPNCRNRTATGPQILHHDLHGAMNIRHIFLEQSAGRPRPTCFTRGTDKLSNRPSDFHELKPRLRQWAVGVRMPDAE